MRKIALPLNGLGVMLVLLALAGCGIARDVPPPNDQHAAAERLRLAQMRAAQERQARADISRQLGLADRLYHASYDLLVAAVPFCAGRTRWDVGLNVQNPQWLDPRRARHAGAVLGIGPGEVVAHSVVPESAAHLAGVHVGDIILEANAAAVTVTDGAYRLPAWQARNVLVVGRGTARLTLAVGADELCDQRMLLSTASQVTSHAAGDAVIISAGLLDMLAGEDTILRHVISREIAHNALHHDGPPRPAAPAASSATDATVGGPGRNWPPEIAREADYVGLYIVARAGIGITDAPALWRRFADRPGLQGDGRSPSPPSTPARAHALAEAVREIDAQLADGADPLPRHW